MSDGRGAWRTLDTNLEDTPAAPSGAKRVCIATPDILGPIKNGGIGTAYHHLARQLAAWGPEVMIAYVNYNAADAAQMADARALYASHGVAFEPVVSRPAAETPLARVPAPGWTLLELAARPRAALRHRPHPPTGTGWATARCSPSRSA